jgi:hypothetical protein
MDERAGHVVHLLVLAEEEVSVGRDCDVAGRQSTWRPTQHDRQVGARHPTSQWAHDQKPVGTPGEWWLLLDE